MLFYSWSILTSWLIAHQSSNYRGGVGVQWIPPALPIVIPGTITALLVLSPSESGIGIEKISFLFQCIPPPP